jgi:hypothetical protein
MSGFPQKTDIAFSEVVGVVGVGILGVILSWLRVKGEV